MCGACPRYDSVSTSLPETTHHCLSMCGFTDLCYRLLIDLLFIDCLIYVFILVCIGVYRFVYRCFYMCLSMCCADVVIDCVVVVCYRMLYRCRLFCILLYRLLSSMCYNCLIEFRFAW
jgi:hypothetical protein